MNDSPDDPGDYDVCVKCGKDRSHHYEYIERGTLHCVGCGIGANSLAEFPLPSEAESMTLTTAEPFPLPEPVARPAEPPAFAPLPAAHPSLAGHAGYLALLDEMRALHLKKAADYGRGADPLANCRASEEFGVPAWQGVMIRANDKVHRIKSYCQNGALANEGVRDSLMDLAAYALIACALFDEAAAKKGGAA